MDSLEFLVEEPSMAEVLRVLLPQFLPEHWHLGVNCFIRIHEGKQDLKRSIPLKIRAACNKRSRTSFVIVHDQDSNDCRALKKELVALCNQARFDANNVSFLVRIVCHELEAWYLGDMLAMNEVFTPHRVGGLKLHGNPDDYVNPKEFLKKRVGDYPQIETARCFAEHMSLETNSSRSFNCFIEGVKRLAEDTAQL